MKSSTNHALKEWAVAVDALQQGKTIMLLRKGGIHEQGGHFKVAHEQVLLYPTYEHQQPSLLKDDYTRLVKPVSSGWHPETILISTWAKITDILLVSDETIVSKLLPFHIWNEQFISDRLKWKPRQPLYILLLRTYNLALMQPIPYLSKYGGCKSWIDLADAIAIDDAQPVLDEMIYRQMVDKIRSISAYQNV